MILLDWIGAWPLAAALRASSTAYLLVNAAHILGIGLILGAILPLDLRLMGAFPSVRLENLAPFLLRVGATGLALALGTGACLFTVQPATYIGNTAFLAKLAILTLALLTIALQHGHRGFRVAIQGGPVAASVRLFALMSFILWIGALVAGRWIGFL